jgi:hypothetical protein
LGQFERGSWSSLPQLPKGGYFGGIGVRKEKCKMRMMGIGAMIALLVMSPVPAYSQSVGVEQDSPMRDMLDRPAKEKAAEAEREYQKALKSIKPNAPAKNDPWGGVRAAEPKQGQQSK